MPHLSAMLVPNPDKISYSSPSMLPAIYPSAGLEYKGGVSFPVAVLSLLEERGLSVSIVIVSRLLRMSKNIRIEISQVIRLERSQGGGVQENLGEVHR